ncbi:FeS assembly scaffold SufA [Neorhizobium galegae bv. officinalis bv. officinalis str. HAMBI 1141]|uniref:FeS assembly scaffold SufA n=1 Tax=Neorhizobium galegae bv. officinalis bv. officinalis str. HAMBI 1141 TaxID=1028801 RepID=A0A068T7K4_NEOGA|nr:MULTISPECIES: Fe-S cluster assembly scaffold SufA [Neorhizobium]MCJ9673964.1 Fe-S cluster assembly scaffold SufA [Neorhizobium sp. SHOUNA12B]MCJ9744211.1 Fe-S cluster assembly scaffold SufA [Neorhizobium sp. SHOUNA12A]MCJ9754066.1 Fe-S cluster assembly scaffold SufA [Neorhizobium sp. BETTINA12A]CDN54074.1 FeS assembly scaffold SufA [Neorhizobium galegae bv. officinalis bv. officinalis str. HAMBI 1141]
MGFAIMTMTDAAATRVKQLVANSGTEAKGLRVGIKKGGCAGMEYTVDLVTEPNAKDDMIEHDGASVWIEPSAVLYLLGTQMDFEVTQMRSGFTFVNPNQTSACGCGESVELKPADLAALAKQREAEVHA